MIDNILHVIDIAITYSFIFVMGFIVGEIIAFNDREKKIEKLEQEIRRLNSAKSERHIDFMLVIEQEVSDGKG